MIALKPVKPTPMSVQDPYCYLASEHYATGEGMTICLYIARCYLVEDEIESFKHRFGFYAEYFELYDRQHFFDQYKSLIPSQVTRFIEDNQTPAAFCWSCEYHMNYS